MEQGRGRSEARSDSRDGLVRRSRWPRPRRPRAHLLSRPGLRPSSCPGPAQSSFPCSGPGLSEAPRPGLW